MSWSKVLIKGSFLMILIIVTYGCGRYQPYPLSKVNEGLKKPPFAEIRITPHEAAVMAILHNHKLKTERDKLKLSHANFSESISNPSTRGSFGIKIPLKNASFIGYDVGISWLIGKLTAEPLYEKADKFDREEMRLKIAWDEWLMANTAQLKATKVLYDERKLSLLNNILQKARENVETLSNYLSEGIITIDRFNDHLDYLKSLIIERVKLQQKLNNDKFALKKAIGLTENCKLTIIDNANRNINIEKLKNSISLIDAKRFDILALKKAYSKRETMLKASYAEQILPVSISLNFGKDTDNAFVISPGIAISFPTFNKSKLKVKGYERRIVYDEYENRLYMARITAQKLLSNLRKLRSLLKIELNNLENLRHRYNLYKNYCKSGLISYLQLIQLKRKTDLLKLKILDLNESTRENLIALAMDTGTSLED